MSKLSLKDILSGDILAKQWFKQQYKLILLSGGLIFIYIYNGYLGERQQYHLSNLKKELQDAQFVKQTLHAQVMNNTRQSYIAAELSARGSKVKESRRAATRIK